MASVGRKAFEYRSEQVWGDLPVVHISVGGRQADGRYRFGRARGIIALGDIATGLVAIGGVAIGLFSAGGVAIGLVALGGVAIGLVAVGAVSIGLLAVGPWCSDWRRWARSRSVWLLRVPGRRWDRASRGN
jgi:hypothetical protein